MQSKNYFEIKDAIRDGMSEYHKLMPKDSKTEPPLSLAWLSKIFSIIIPLLSVFFTLITNFIGMGRVWYFQFDFNNYNFNISKIDFFIFIYSLLSCFFGLIIAILSANMFKKLIKNQVLSFLLDLITFVLITVIVSYAISKFLNISIIGMYFRVLAICTGTVWHCLTQTFKRNTFIMSAIVVCLAVVICSGFIGFHYHYQQAEAQRDFKIIMCSTNEAQETYAVINEDQHQYSAYACKIHENNLRIFVNEQKFFDKETCQYDEYRFENIEFYERINVYSSEVENYTVLEIPSSID